MITIFYFEFAIQYNNQPRWQKKQEGCSFVLFSDQARAYCFRLLVISSIVAFNYEN